MRLIRILTRHGAAPHFGALLLVCTLALPARGQRVADIRAAALQTSRVVMSADADQMPVATDSSSTRPRWRTRLGLAGAVLGAVGVTIYVVRQCDLGCRDDGALAWTLPIAIPVGAIGGAAIGALIGAAIDRRRD